MKFIMIPFISSILFSAILNVPGNYPTIQQGIIASADGDTVLVQPGTYVENINFNGKNITVGSLFIISGDRGLVSQTVIDGNLSGSVVTFESGEDSTAVISGFTLTNGSGHSFDGYCGGGIYTYNSSPTIEYLDIIGNSVTGFGFSWPAGGGICIWFNSQPTIRNVLIADNYAYEGAGIIDISSLPSKLSNLTIVNNYAEWRGGCISGYGTEDQPLIIQNTICRENSSGLGEPEIYHDPQLIYSNISDGFPGEGNIDEDPLFWDPENHGYSLQADSPCIDTGNPDLDGDGITWEDDPDDQDPDGTRMDMGALYLDQSNCEYSADFDGDGSFDLGDLFIMLDLILELSGPPSYDEICVGDGDLDGIVTVNDIPPDEDECDGFAPYVPDLPAIELILSDHAVLASDSLIVLDVYLNNPQSIHALQFDLVFPDGFSPFATNTDAGEIGFILNPGNLDNRVRIVVLDLWVWPPDSPTSLLCQITLENPGISGDYDIFIDRGFAPGECNQPYDLEGNTALLQVFDEPQVSLYFGEHNMEDQAISFWVDCSVDFLGIQTQLTGVHLVEGFGPNEGMSQYGWLLSWGSSGVILSFGFGHADPGLYHIGPFEYEYLTADEICFSNTTISGEFGYPLFEENGPCLPVDYCSIPGDVNGDGQIDIQDVVLVVDCILQFGICDCADTNDDDNVDIIDIVHLIFIILGD